MPKIALRRIMAVIVAVVAVAAVPRTAVAGGPTVQQCRGAIAKAGSAYAVAMTKSLGKCAERVALGKAPSPCPDPKTISLAEKAKEKLGRAIVQACGGKDKQCGVASLVPDVPLAAIGWNVGNCSTVSNGLCEQPIADCGDVVACVACIADQAIDRSFDVFDPPDLVTGDKWLRKCLRGTAKQGAAALVKTMVGLGKCWLDVNKRDSGGSFSCPDAKASTALAHVKTAHARELCKSCGGPSGACGGNDDLAPAAFGFPTECPNVASCAGPIQTLNDVARCTDCVVGALADAALRGTIPAFATTPPPQCVVVP